MPKVQHHAHAYSVGERVLCTWTDGTTRELQHYCVTTRDDAVIEGAKMSAVLACWMHTVWPVCLAESRTTEAIR